ncbi:purine/pyrimidine permease [Methanofollis sp. UBA420]|jgi:uracil permease|uniref:uracil-xanthine permease family protein n=1 Tax=Methanofollis sp. UBA420 TaxID=1915514 RepID=UPI00316AC046
MHFTYGLDDKPGIGELAIFGLQWLAVSVPAILIIGSVVSALQPGGSAIAYMQKLFLVIALVLLVQVLWGHRLPLVVGPATVLLIGVLASMEHGVGAINASIMIGGAILALLSATGLFKYLKMLFTPRVIVVILLLIAFTLAPVILTLITADGVVSPVSNFTFALVFALALFCAGGLLKGMWKATLAIWALLLGSLAYYLVFGTFSVPATNAAILSLPEGLIAPLVVPDAGVLAAFLICFLALAINELGSIQSVGGLLQADRMDERVNRGMTVTGLGNALSGVAGVIGPVDFSLSPGVIAATGCASRFALVPAALALMAIGFSPLLITYLSSIPQPVIGIVLAYVMTAQIAAGLMLGEETRAVASFEDGLVIGIPVLIGTVVAFLPAAIAAGFPATLRPVIANGFVVGVVLVLILEHFVYRKRGEA